MSYFVIVMKFATSVQLDETATCENLTCALSRALLHAREFIYEDRQV